MIRWIFAGAAAGAVVALIESAALGGDLHLSFVTLGLLIPLGIAGGVLVGGLELVARKINAPPVGRAAILSLASLPPLILASRHLFDGGYAATLPGATTGHLWVPAIGYFGLGLLLWLAPQLIDSGLRRRLLAAGLALLLIPIEYVNRTIFPSLYPDVHAFLVIASLIAATVAIYLVGGLERLKGRQALVAGSIGLGGVAVLLGCTLAFGLQSEEHRWKMATDGTHLRHVARLVRGVLDLDRDGYARVLGGGDCDDLDASRNPRATDIPGNGIDEDCDGMDLAAETQAQKQKRAAKRLGYQQALDRWRSSPAVVAALQRTRSHHIVFVLVDALRADVFAKTAENKKLFPHLHALAAQSAHFTRAFSNASGTDAGMGALLVGRVQPWVKVRTTTMEALQKTGRKTAAVMPTEVLRWAGKTLIARGFDQVLPLKSDGPSRDVGERATGHLTTNRGRRWLDRNREALETRPAFLWLHYFDAHEHHQMKTSDPRLAAKLAGESSPDTARKYRAAAQLVDEEIGRVVQDLEDRNLWERTIVVLLADHGESLGEDPRLPDTHGLYLYTALVHVPLLVRIPGVAPKKIDHPVSLLDVPPTLLDLAGAEHPEKLDGFTLIPYLLEGAPAEVLEHRWPIVLNESDQHGVIVWPYKLMIRPKDNLIELFDLSRDFLEQHDLSDRKRERVVELRRVYQRYPQVVIDRSRKARRARERLARPPK